MFRASGKGSFRRSVVAVLLGAVDVCATPICYVRYSISGWYFYSQILRSLVACLVMSAYTGANLHSQAFHVQIISCVWGTHKCIFLYPTFKHSQWHDIGPIGGRPVDFIFPSTSPSRSQARHYFFPLLPLPPARPGFGVTVFLRSFRCFALFSFLVASFAFVFRECFLSPLRAFALFFLLTLWQLVTLRVANIDIFLLVILISQLIWLTFFSEEGC